jgi:hypothetical protein
VNSKHKRAHFEMRCVDHYLEGFFLRARRKHSLEFLLLFLFVAACSSAHIEVNDTNPRSTNEHALRDLLFHHLKAAEESVDVAVYRLNDREFANCLIGLHHRDIRVRLFLDKAQMTQRSKLRTELGENGIPIRFSSEPGSIGDAFCIIDGRKLIRGSPDRFSELYHRNRGHIAISTDKELVEALWNFHFSIIYPYRF